jgi:hypothetical protein
MEFGGDVASSEGNGGGVGAGVSVPGWNVHLSGTYQAAMAARGAILREAPRDIRRVIKAPRGELLDVPIARGSLKADIKRRLEDIAADTRAAISVLSGSSGSSPASVFWSSAPSSARPDASARFSSTDRSRTAKGGSAAPSEGRGAASVPSSTKGSIDGIGAVLADGECRGGAEQVYGFGLETERMCAVVITGSMESVELAKVRVLVMLDELVSVLLPPIVLFY